MNIINCNTRKIDKPILNKLRIMSVRDQVDNHVTLDDVISISLSEIDYDDGFIDGLVDLINNDPFDSIGFKINKLSMLSEIDPNKYPYLLEKYTDLKDNKLFYVFIENTNVNFDTIFKAYDKGYNVFDCIFYHSLYSFAPIYIKNNKLTTIKGNKEISTERDININHFIDFIDNEKKRILNKIIH